MLNAPALIVRRRSPTLVIGVLLTCLMAIAAIGVSLELFRAHAAIALVLVPQIFVLIAAGMLRLAYDRWATSLVCLSVSVAGLSLPGVTRRPIPWTGLRRVRCICSNPTPEHAATPRYYLLFDVETPAVRGSGPSVIVRRHARLVVLDVSELDTSKDVILGTLRRYYPAAVDPDLLTWQGSQEVRFQPASRPARADEIWIAILARWHRRATRFRIRTQVLVNAAVALQRTTLTHLQRSTLQLRDTTVTSLARGQRMVRVTAIGVRYRFVRSL